MSDMYALIHYSEANPVHCHLMRRRNGSLGVCNNINQAQGHVTNAACKSVLMDLLDGTYYCIEREGRALRQFHSLHFQGNAKILLPLFIDRDIMAMRFEGSTIADMYRHYLESKREWLRTNPGQAMLAVMRSTPSRSLLDGS